MTIVIVPPYPQRNDPNFANIADSWNSQLPTWTDQVNATAVDVANKQALAAQSVVDCQSQVTLATNQAVLAQGYKNDTLILSEATASTANVSKWISGTTYAEGVNVWSPTDYHTYRRKAAGSGTTDPLLDTTNWEPVYIPAAMILLSTANANNVATVEFTGLNSLYDKYIVEGFNIISVTVNKYLYCQVQIGGSWQTTGYKGSAADDPSIALLGGYPNEFSLSIKKPHDTNVIKIVESVLHSVTATGTIGVSSRVYYKQSLTEAVTGLRFIMESGNISSGTFKLYGIKA